MQPLRIAVVGAGQPNIATSSHLPAIKYLQNVELVALCDINGGVEEYAREYGVVAYRNFEQLLADKSIDAVLIATPDWLHAEQCIAAAKAGKHILCEKPIATSYEQVAEMKKAVKAAGVIFMAAHMRIFSSQVQAFKTSIDSGEIGNVVYGRASVKGAFFPYPPGSRYYKKEALGQFLHNGPHYVDTLCYLMNARPVHVHGVTRSYYPDPAEKMETPNYTLATVRFDDSSIGCIEQNLTLLNPRGYPTREQLEIIGTKATLRWDSHVDATMVTYKNGFCTFGDPQLAGTDNNPFYKQLEHFADCIKHNREPITSIDKAAEGLSICLQALNSV